MVSPVAALRRLHARVLAERDFFRPFELLLALAGFHLARPWRGRRTARLLFAAMRALTLFQYAVWVDKIWLALGSGASDRAMALHYGNTFGALTMMLSRGLVFRWYMPDLERLMAYVRRQRASAPRPAASYRKLASIALAFQMIAVADRAVYAFSRTYRDELYEMPRNVARLGGVARALVQGLSVDFALRWGAAYNVSLTGMNSIMVGLHDELYAIAQQYRLLLLRRRDRPPSGPPSDDFWARLEGTVAHTVRRHVHFLRELERLRPFLRTTFLLMFYSAALFLALGTFVIGAAGSTTYGLVLSIFLLALVLECYWCCQLVDRLNEANELIGELLYGLDWPEQLRWTAADAPRYRQARTSLLIMMGISRRSLGITCGGMFEMSRVAFTSLVKLTYTMLAFLRDTQRLN